MAEGWKYCLRHIDEDLELTEGKLMVGRSRHCDLSIQEPSISRKHVFLTVGSGRIALQDLGSSNGTFVNDRQVVGESAVQDGDSLRLGNAVLTVEIRPGDRVAESRAAKPKTSNKSGPTPDYQDGDPTKHVESSDLDWSALQGERAGLWPRLAAILLDGVWVAALAWPGYLLGGRQGALAAPLLLLLVTWLGWGLWGTTPGKRMLRIYVFSVETEVPGKPGTGLLVSAVRIAGCLLSLSLFGLGILAIAFSKTRLALHDRLSGTYVVRR